MRKIVGILLGLSFIVPSAYGDSSFREERESGRRAIIGRSGSDIVAPGPGDQAKDLVDNYQTWNLAVMEKRGLLSARLEQSPWTDSYWPTYAGGIANRYGDPQYQASSTWGENESYLQKMMGNGASLELSPAEKYDLLLGLNDFPMTKKMLKSSSSHVEVDGTIPSWFGLCHGWAAASFMLPRPKKAVTVQAADGRKIVFTPSDIKALATLLWSNAPTETRFVGGRCNNADPQRDPRHREIDPECFDSNPATWHLAVVNQLGLAKRSFVLDADEGQEVWNQPVYSYSYSYRHPVTRMQSKKLDEAKVALSDFEDPYFETRARNAVNVVNVVMSLTYVVENSPSLSMVDGPEHDSHQTVTYSYDLELDRNDNIVGGEWHSSKHPDFLWVPIAGSKAKSIGDEWLFRSGDRSFWDEGKPLPEPWVQAARFSIQRDQPLANIVERLIDLSNR